jgi:hypothetical protein
MSTTTKNTQATKTVSQGESRYGTPEPRDRAPLPQGHQLPRRKGHAAQARRRDRAGDARGRALVREHRGLQRERGRVYLELADATPAEAARGMALLEKVAI